MDLLEKFFQMNRYIQGSYDSPDDFEKLNREISKLDKSASGINRLFYLALPPSVYESVATNIHMHCMATGCVIFCFKIHSTT
jgi:glucose-6-phosphate 1-dehydrogenase